MWNRHVCILSFCCHFDHSHFRHSFHLVNESLSVFIAVFSLQISIVIIIIMTKINLISSMTIFILAIVDEKTLAGTVEMKKCLEETQTLRAGQKFSRHRRPPFRGRRMAKI